MRLYTIGINDLGQIVGFGCANGENYYTFPSPRACHAFAVWPRCGDVEKKTLTTYD